ncbi:MAG: hypothetical protein PW792_09020 [Acidobacteriaceae bacterium]|nr:hypothetical protein [Acidobacteriaceae bacterium]
MQANYSPRYSLEAFAASHHQVLDQQNYELSSEFYQQFSTSGHLLNVVTDWFDMLVAGTLFVLLGFALFA